MALALVCTLPGACDSSGLSGRIDATRDGDSDGAGPPPGCGDGILADGEECDPAVEPESACLTACGTPGTRTCSGTCTWEECTAEEICGNHVDEDCDGLAAQYHVIGEPVDLGRFRLTSVVYTGESFAVAGHARGDTSWEGHDPVDAVYFGLLAPDGTWRREPVQMTEGTTYASRYPSVAFSGSEFGMAWIDEVSYLVLESREGVFFTRVSTDGEKLGADVAIVQNDVRERVSRKPPDAFFTGSEYGIVWEEEGRMALSRLGPGGARRGDALDLGVDGRPFEILWSGSWYHLFFSGWEEPGRAIRFTPSGDMVDTVLLPPEEHFRTGMSDSHLGLAWTGGEEWSDTDTYFALLDLEGRTVAAPAKIQDTEARSGVLLVGHGAGGFGVVSYTTDSYTVEERHDPDSSYVLTEFLHHAYLTWVPEAGGEPGPNRTILHVATRMASGACCGEGYIEYVSTFLPISLIHAGSEFGLFYVHGQTDRPSSYMLRIACEA